MLSLMVRLRSHNDKRRCDCASSYLRAHNTEFPKRATETKQNVIRLKFPTTKTIETISRYVVHSLEANLALFEMTCIDERYHIVYVVRFRGIVLTAITILE